MKVVHVCSVIGPGGAAHSMLNLHQGLLNSGVESAILAECCQTQSDHFFESPHRSEIKNALARASWDLVWNNRTPLSNTHFSLDLFGQRIADHPLVKDADVINLHWVSGFLSSVSLASLAQLQKPIVWTLHDIHPLTGGCHFSAGCERFHDACGNCPQLNTDYWGLTAGTHHAMKMAVAMIQPHYVAPSEWMLNNVKASGVSSQASASLIRYGVDLTIFRPGQMDQARGEFSLTSDCCYILLASHSLKEKRKGLSQALEVLQQIRHSDAGKEAVTTGKLRLLCCGHDTEDLIAEGWMIDRLGFLSSARMALLYQSASMLLFTSLEDNLPNVILEAMACGLPVVAHAVGGAIDLLGGENAVGLLFDSGDFAKGSEHALRFFSDSELYKEMSMRGIAKVADQYSIKLQAEKYQELYQDLIRTKNQGLNPISHLVIEGAREQVAIGFCRAIENEATHLKNLIEVNKSLVAANSEIIRFNYIETGMLSVVIPTLDCANQMVQHIESMRPWLDLVCEIIVVDSHSTDGTLEVIREHLQHDNLKIITHPRGLYQSWNHAILQTAGKWIYISTVGDSIERKQLEHMLHAGNALGSDVVTSPPAFVFDDHITMESPKWPISHILEFHQITKPTEISPSVAFVHAVRHSPCSILGSSASNLYRGEHLRLRPFPTDYGNTGDTGWGIKYALETRFCLTNRVGSVFRFHSETYTRVDDGWVARLVDSLGQLSQQVIKESYVSNEAKEILAMIENEELLHKEFAETQKRYGLAKRSSMIPWYLRINAVRLRAQRNIQRNAYQELSQRLENAFKHIPLRTIEPLEE